MVYPLGKPHSFTLVFEAGGGESSAALSAGDLRHNDCAAPVGASGTRCGLRCVCLGISGLGI